MLPCSALRSQRPTAAFPTQQRQARSATHVHLPNTFQGIMGRARVLATGFVSACLPGIATSFVEVSPRGTSTSGTLRSTGSPQLCPTFVVSSSASPSVLRDRHHRLRLYAKKKKSDSGRPSLDDVERLSRGQAAKKRGTGSRGVCHRLNESERKARRLLMFPGSTAHPLHRKFASFALAAYLDSSDSSVLSGVVVL